MRILVVLVFIMSTSRLSAQNEWSYEITAEDGVIVSSEDLGAQHDFSVTKETLNEGLSRGVELVTIETSSMTLVVCPTRGMSLMEAESNGVKLGWRSPVAVPVHPQFIRLNDRGGLGWLAGFNEMMVRCGVEFAGHPGEDNGTMLTLHGRVGNIPAEQVQVVVENDAPHRIRIEGLVREQTFKFGVFELWTSVSVVPGSSSVRIEDKLINRSEYQQEYQIIYHANFGENILEKGAKFVAPIQSVAPFDDYAAKDLSTFDTYLGPTRDYGEQVYCATMFANDENLTTTLLKSAESNRGVAVRYKTDSLPYFTLWKNTDTETDGYVTGLEPATGFPYNRSIERSQGRVPRLDPGEAIQFLVEIEALASADEVQAVAEEIENLQAGREPEVFETRPVQDD